MNSDSTFDDEQESQDIAIIGMAAHLPGAQNVEQFWNNLKDGIESIEEFSDESLLENGVPASTLKDVSYIKSGAPLSDMEMFDASFFGFSPKEAMILDPQHRHFLECSWEALENAGYDPERFAGAIGVFGGSGHNAYLPYNLLSNPELVKSVGFFLLRHTGNDKDFLTTRVSYILDLKGPSIAVQTACSTSLVAAHAACQSILNGECDMALAGGATIELPHRQGYTYKEGEILSPDGHCRAFDENSKGTIFGSGAGVIVLKKLDAAIKDGDTVHAVIKGSAINNDGSMKMGYLAPSVDGQSAAIDEAIAISDIDPTSIGYIEMHGTGTPVGDPIEVSALTQAYRGYTEDKQFCAIGSVKTNIGHLDTAAGVAGLIKVVESLKHQQIPASLNYEKPNPAIDFASSPFYVNDRLRDWRTNGDEPRRAAVNSLGVGGTNAHVILEEAPVREASSASRPHQLLMLTARTQNALEQATDNLVEHLKEHPEMNLADIAHTLRVGRKLFSQQRIVVCSDHDDAIETLEKRDPKRVFSFSKNGDTPSIAFMFTGQGAQYAGMGRDLYEGEAVYRDAVDRCAEILKSHLALDLRDLLYPVESELDAANERLQMTSITQPALFVTEYALASLWNSWGIEAKAMIGHSIGEYVAAYFAGVFSLDDALSLVAVRGRLMESMPAGDMMAVPLPEAEITPLLGSQLSLAGINSAGLSVVSGETDAVETLRKSLEEKEVSCRKLHTSHAFHSVMMEPVLAPFTELLSKTALSAPDKPFISNSTGTWITAEQATSPEYWAAHLRGTVRFADGLDCLLEEPDRLLLEVGPGNTLISFARQNPNKSTTHVVLNSMRHPKESLSDAVFMLNTLGRLWMAGVSIDSEAFERDELRYRVPLPTYPFEKQRLWVEPGVGNLRDGAALASATDKQLMDDWFYQPTWTQTPSFLSATDVNGAVKVVIFLGDDELGELFAENLRSRGMDVITVVRGSHFEALSQNAFQLNPDSPQEFERVFDTVAKQGAITHVVNLWNLSSDVDIAGAEQQLDNSFYQLVYLVQALGKLDAEESIDLVVLSEGMQQVAGEALFAPIRAPIQGVCKVANNEFPLLNCSSVDIQWHDLAKGRRAALLECLTLELLNTNDDEVIAYRGESRFVQDFEKIALPDASDAKIRDGGVYLITGGLGGLGLSLAEHLVDAANAKVALVSRRSLPPESEWDQWLDRHALNDVTSEQITAIKQMTLAGHAPLLITADVTDYAQMSAAVTQVTQTLGDINGVFHTAGVLDDGLIPFKTKESMAAVMAAKVQGTLVLDRLFADAGIDFCVLYSSVSSAAGIAGQVDYTAANAFLNAFSRYRRDLGGTPMIAVNWGVWQKVGMAAKLAEGMGVLGEVVQPFEHPFYAGYRSWGHQEEEFSIELSVNDSWLLDQHRTKAGIPLIPGTGYLEFARAAYDARNSGIPIEISNVLFMSPFSVKGDEHKMLCVKLEYDGCQADFSVLSRGGEGESAWCDEHVQGSISYLAEEAPSGESDVAAIIARCDKRHEVLTGTAEHAHLSFGERWKHVDRIDFGDTEAVITMTLPEQFGDDFNVFALHPAMLDLATGAAQSLIPGFVAEKDFLVPISYSKVKIYGPLKPQMYSHVKYSADADNADIAYFDVTIMDRSGKVLVSIERFVMKQVEHTALVGIDERKTLPNRGAAHKQSGDGDSAFAESLTVGLLPEEGLSALTRILGGHYLPQVIVSPVDFKAYLISSKLETGAGAGDDESDDGLSDGIDRPNIPTAYVEPSGESELVIAKVWQNALGINKIGVHDNFFELGGHSLLLTQIVARVRKQLKKELPLSDVFELPTIAEWASIIGEIGDGEDVVAVPEVMPVDREKYRMTRADLKKAVGY